MRRSVTRTVLLVSVLLLGGYLLHSRLTSPIVPKARAGVPLIGVGTIPRDARGLFGLKGLAVRWTLNDRLAGLGSAISYTGRGDEYLLASDSGPKGRPFQCRVHRMTVTVKPGAKEPVTLELTATTLLTAEDGTPFSGAPEHAKMKKFLPLDPEGVRVGRGGVLFVSDEYGPVVDQFDGSGRRVKSFAVPARFPLQGEGGRQENRGMEGLAISPGGMKLYGAMQSPLMQDGGRVIEKGKRAGVNCRILEIDIGKGKTREFVYKLDDPDNGVCEILAVSDTAFLVLERDGHGGKAAAFKKVFRIDLVADASDVSNEAALPAGELPAAVTPVKKTPFLDLLAKEYGIAGPECPEKFEGLAFGRDLPNGRHLLLVTTDNDFLTGQPFRVYAFAIDQAALPGFRRQRFDPE